jgi:NAD(P)-dependent dehydrogenase (short-subunit alcohol dehydrogenase family)
VLVTGGNRGIGLGIARGVARAGADVVIWARDAAASESAASELRQLGVSAVAFECDVSDEAAVRTAFARTLDETGHVDAAFVNAGISGPPVSFIDVTTEEWRRVLDVNLEGAMFTLREVACEMVRRDQGGALIGIASIAGLTAMGKWSQYAASKAALLSLMRTLAVELGRYRIRCNALIPGWVETDMTAGMSPELAERVLLRMPGRRLGVPEDFGAAAAFLADPTQTFHTGDALVLDGGYTLV